MKHISDVPNSHANPKTITATLTHAGSEKKKRQVVVEAKLQW